MLSSALSIIIHVDSKYAGILTVCDVALIYDDIIASALLAKCAAIQFHTLPLNASMSPSAAPNTNRGRNPKNCRCIALNINAVISADAIAPMRVLSVIMSF